MYYDGLCIYNDQSLQTDLSFGRDYTAAVESKQVGELTEYKVQAIH